MEELFREDAFAAGASLGPDAWEELVRCYGAGPYHNLEHAASVRGCVLKLGGEPATLVAAWYHDAIYEVGAADNEERSALLAHEAIGESELADEVARLILVTADHLPSRDDREGQILSDADLSILACDPEGYVKYHHAIRAEYSRLSDREFWVGRLAFLERFLRRERIFFTREMQGCERLALGNMRTETAWLQIRLGNP